MDPFAWLDAIFGDDGGVGSGVQGGPQLNQGFAPVAGWMVSQAFAGAGPVGQYMGALYGSPDLGMPRVEWATPGYDPDAPALDFTQGVVTFADEGPTVGSPSSGRSVDGPSATSAADAGRTGASESPMSPGDRVLETLDRDGSTSARSGDGAVHTVNVNGTPRPDWPPTGIPWLERYLQSQQNSAYTGPERPFTWEAPSPPAPVRLRSPRGPADRGPGAAASPGGEVEQPRPERDPGDRGAYGDDSSVPGTRPYAATGGGSGPWASDAAVPEQLLPWGAWERPEAAPAPRTERAGTGSLENVSTVPAQRTFWDRGGTGLAAGAVTAAVGIAVVFWWNPVGWVAGASAALAIAGGVAATAASAVELSASYGGATSAGQDAEMDRAISATLGYSSVGGVLGGVSFTVVADDPRGGFQQGTWWGGMAEGAASLPGVLRAVPGIWHAATPWAKSLLVTPAWFFVSAGSGGGSSRTLARMFAAQGRGASRVRRVAYLGTTPLLERDADWARYQVAATGTRQESVFRVSYADGRQQVVLADRFWQRSGTIWEAKLGDMGQMWDPQREAHIINQAATYLDITLTTGGGVGYRVSTRLGAERLGQRFGREFPADMSSGRLWVDWVPWRR